MTDKRIKSYLEDRLKRLESIRNERGLTTAELGDIACCKQTLAFINSLQEEPVSKQKLSNVQRNEKNWKEPVSEDLEEAVNTYIGYAPEVDECSSVYGKRQAFKAGAKWQKEQFEKNRLDACDRQTEEEAEIERDFCIGIIENEHRQPTFDDAIKYGMRLQRENMMKDAVDAVVHIEAGNYPYIPQLELYDYDKDIPLAKEGDKYKVVLINEE